MRILQLIDSLRPGGAEQMAVAYANALSRRGCKSYLCSTRMEGLLKKRLEPEVGYLFLGKKHILDWKAFLKLRNYVREERIELIQAHSSSVFLAVLVKWSLPEVKLIWQDHYGRELKRRRTQPLKLVSRSFDGIISVNEALKTWAEEHLHPKKVSFFRNFITPPLEAPEPPPLEGEGFKILCLANLRSQKDHWNLLKAFQLVLEEEPEVSLHLVGKEEEVAYADALKEYLRAAESRAKVFFYGEQEQVQGFLKQADLGVLSSSSEGLPLALLEYGQAGLPVVCTEVGECPKVLGNYGKLVPPRKPEALAAAMLEYIRNKDLRERDALSFQQWVNEHYSEAAVIGEVVAWMDEGWSDVVTK